MVTETDPALRSSARPDPRAGALPAVAPATGQGKGDAGVRRRADEHVREHPAPAATRRYAFWPAVVSEARVRRPKGAASAYLFAGDARRRDHLIKSLMSFGEIGRMLLEMARARDEGCEFWSGPTGYTQLGRGFVDVNEVYRIVGGGLYVRDYERASALVTRCELAGRLDLGMIVALAGYAYPIEGCLTFNFLDSLVPAVPDCPLGFELGGSDLEFFPLKKHTSAKTKTNVWFSNVAGSTAEFKPDAWRAFQRVGGYLHGAFNDTASAFLAWYQNVYTHAPVYARYLLANWDDKAVHSSFSNCVKSAGTVRDVRLVHAAETWSLMGRGVGVVDWEEERRMRLDEPYFREHCAAKVAPGPLREAVRRIIREEMTEPPEYGDVESHFTKRFAWVKSGAHSVRAERAVMGEDTGYKGQMNKRVFAEQLSENPMFATEPKSVFTSMEKLEEGKVRAVYNCDTISYFNFDYLLRPVERVWKNAHVLLSPSGAFSGPQYARLARNGKKYKIMADYDGFNEQHSLANQRMVIEEVCAGAPPECLAWALASFDNSWVYFPDANGMPEAECHRLIGTLLSGHRATTLINSVLNRAYLIVVVGDPFDELEGDHAGDDVLLQTDSAAAVDHVAACLARGEVRMNRSKQAFLMGEGEFLRIRFSRSLAVGYPARCLASVVSGSWVTNRQLDEMEYLMSLLNLAWTICNRSFDDNAALFLMHDFRRRVPQLAQYGPGLLRGHISLNGSPVRLSTGYLRLIVDVATTSDPVDLEDEAANATQDYLTLHTDHTLLRDVGLGEGQLFVLMKEASYSVKIKKWSQITGVGAVAGIHTITRDWHLAGKAPKVVKGVLCDKFPFSFLSGSLDLPTVRKLLIYYGYTLSGDLMELAWGPKANTVCCPIRMCYSDARSLGYAEKRSALVRSDFICAY